MTRQLGFPDASSDTLLNESSLPPVDSGKGAWTYLITSTILEIVIWGFPCSFGVFLEAYLDNPDYSSQPNSATLLPLIGNLSMGVMFLSGPVVYPLCNRFPHHRRLFLWGGTLLCIISLFCASFTKNVMALLVLEGVTYALGGSLRYATCLSYFSEWFVQRQGLANGVISAGSVAGGLVLPLLFPALIARTGPEMALRYIAIAMACITIPVIPFLKGRLPETKAQIRRPVPRGSGRTQMERLKKWMSGPTFWFVMAMNFAQGFGYFVPLLYLPTFATDIPLSRTNAALTLALLNGASMISRLAVGILCDLFDCWLLAFVNLSLAALSIFILWGVFSSTFPGLVAFAIIYGGISGGWPSLWTGFTQWIAKDDPAALTTFFAYLMFTRGLANILSTPVAGAFYSNPVHVSASHKIGFEVGGGKFGWMIIFVGFCFVVGAAVTASGWLVERWRKTRTTKGIAEVLAAFG
ncbi:MFS general substrate transporter [Flagelloscypha sp. PMI_526]|nr:MFS general substrate transporter [Flagelloscypha sp. PMI_526]